MKVALLTNFIPPYRKSFLKAFADRVDALCIFLSTPMESGREWSVDWGRLDVRVQKSLTLKRQWKHPSGFTEPIETHIPYDTIWQLWKFGPDIVISGEFGARTFLAALYCWVARKKMVVWATLSERSEAGRGWPRVFFRKMILRAVDLVLVNGKSGERYIEGLGFLRSKIELLPQATDLKPFLELKLDCPGRTQWKWAYWGRLIELKGLSGFFENLIEWLGRHPEVQIELKLLGDGPEKEKIRSLPWTRQVRLEFVKQVAYQDLAQQLEDVGLLVFPSLSDEWGLSVVEALGAGIPVLGSVYSQAVVELIEPGKNGFVFTPDQKKTVFEVFDRVFKLSAQEFKKMSSQARASAQALTADKMAEQLFSILNKKL